MCSSDRGSSQELISLIKERKMPIICTAHDDSFSHMKSLANIYLKTCFDDLHRQQ